MPIVNVDSFRLMSNAFNKRDWPLVQEIRKNQRSKHADCGKYLNGVDLNRNYDIKFNELSKGASGNECSEDYRGPSAFSEPETKAMRDLIVHNDGIVSALNFHAYANMWIHPYSYSSDTVKDILQVLNGRLWNTYKKFMRVGKFFKGIQYGTAMRTIQYTATGEASDWMLHKRNIFAFSPELGYADKGSDTFYPDIKNQKLSVA